MMFALFESAVRSSLLVALVWLLLRAARVRSPAVERTAWVAVLLASIAMPFAVNLNVLPASISPTVDWLPSAEIGAMTISDATNEWQRVCVWIYLGVAGALSLRQFFGLARLWRLRAASIPLRDAADEHVRVCISNAVSSPATVFSTILVPTDFSAWSAADREAALAHERAHITHGDFYLHALASLHRHLFWFNPLAWWLPRHLSLLSEHVSDDAALATGERTAYAELLLRCARKTVGHEQAIAMAGRATLATRIERILDASTMPTRPARWKHVAVAVLFVPIAAVSASVQAEQQTHGAPLTTYFPPTTQGAKVTIPPVNGKVTLPKSNRARPLSQPVYPSVSRQLHETGTVVLKLHVLEDGSVGDAIIEKSSGYPSLDYAAMYESFRWTLDPGTVGGQPQRMWGQFAVTFKLKQ